MSDVVQSIRPGITALVVGVIMLVLGGVAVDVIYSIGQTVTSGVSNQTQTLGIVTGMANTIRILFSLLGTVLIAAGGAFVLYVMITSFMKATREAGAAGG